MSTFHSSTASHIRCFVNVKSNCARPGTFELQEFKMTERSLSLTSPSIASRRELLVSNHDLMSSSGFWLLKGLEPYPTFTSSHFSHCLLLKDSLQFFIYQQAHSLCPFLTISCFQNKIRSATHTGVTLHWNFIP